MRVLLSRLLLSFFPLQQSASVGRKNIKFWHFNHFTLAAQACNHCIKKENWLKRHSKHYLNGRKLSDQQVEQNKQEWVKLDPCSKHLCHSLHSSSGQSNQFKASSGSLPARWLGNAFCLLSSVTNTPKSSNADSHPPVWWELPPPAQADAVG